MFDMPAPVVIVSGPSGVGKTTASRLVARALPGSVHLQADEFTYAIVNGFVEPQLPEAEHQNEVVGGAFAVAAMAFAAGGYAVIVDGHLFPAGVEGLATACASRAIALHYAILRADLPTCLARATNRAAAGRDRAPLDEISLAALHAKFSELGDYERHVVDAAGAPEHAAAAILDGMRSGALLVSTDR